MRTPELLAPAGDWERFEAAVEYGADAVYLADTQFGMRAGAKNFAQEELQKAVFFAHAKGVKVYLTSNVLLKNSEIEAFQQALHIWHNAGVDALIISDMGAFMYARKELPHMELHVSTQAGVTNYLTANQLYELGAQRVVLARELSLEDIRTIRNNVPDDLGIEVFVHGAMCMSFSGRCLISQYMTGRDANHGECAQSCRWKYHLVEEKRPGEYYPVEEDSSGTYFFNAKDLCMLPYLDKLAEAGVDSYKIEGRAKSAFYAAAVTNMYRVGLDLLIQNPTAYHPPQWLLEEPYKVSHREYSTGFFFPEQPPGQVYEHAGYLREWEVTAIVEGWNNGMLTCTQRNRFSVGDTIEILEPAKEPIAFTVSQIINSQGEVVETARHPMEQLQIPFPHTVAKGALVRRPTE